MKKFNWKAMLIVVMAFVMVFALVACDPKDNGNENNGNNNEKTPSDAAAYKYSSIDYFNRLWEVADTIGDEKIEDEDNVYLSADLAVAIGTREYQEVNGDKNSNGRYDQVIVGFKNEKSTELGIKLEAVVDRKNEDSKNTVIKAKLYSGSVEIAGIYYAIAEPDNFYIDFAGQHILFPLHIAFELGDKTFSNNDLGKKLHEMLTDTFNVGKDATKETSIADILKTIVGDMGEGWSLDDLVNGILPVFGLEPKDIVELVKGFGDGFATALTNEKGQLSIKNALTSSQLESLFSSIKNGNRYSVTSSMVESLIGGAIVPAGGRATTHFEVSYETEGDEIKDGVAISVDVKDVTKTTATDKSHPFVEIKIKDMELGAAKNHPLTVTEEDYKKDVQLEVKETLNISGVSVNGNALDGESHDKQFEFGAKLRLDFEQTNLANNKTQANVYVQYGKDKIINLSYVHGKLAIVVDKTPAIGGYPAVDTAVELMGSTVYDLIEDVFLMDKDKTEFHKFADTFFEGGAEGAHNKLNANFKGAVWTDIDPNNVLQSLVDQLATGIKSVIDQFGQNAQGKAVTAAPFVSNNLSDVMYKLFRDAVKSMDDGKLEINIDNTLQFVFDVVNKMFGLPYKGDENNPSENAWTIAGFKKDLNDSIVNMVAMLENPQIPSSPLTEAQLKAASDKIDNAIKELFTGDTKDKLHLALAGVDFSKKGEATYLEYLLSALLDKIGLSFTIDCTKGIDVKSAIKFAGVTITGESQMTVNGAPQEQEDLAKGVTEGTTGWYFG